MQLWGWPFKKVASRVMRHGWRYHSLPCMVTATWLSDYGLAHLVPDMRSFRGALAAPHGLQFSELLSWHLKRGTRPSGQPDRNGAPWSREEFAYAAGKVEVRSVGYWLSGRRPKEAHLQLIQSALFGDNSNYDDWRDQMYEAYAAIVNRKRYKKRQGKSSNVVELATEYEGTSGDRPHLEYPSGARYGELLAWHLFVWGTRAHGSQATSGIPWTVEEFATAVHDENFSAESAVRNVTNWLNGATRPSNSQRISAINAVLFGNSAEFKRWRSEFSLALVLTS